jgi:hypothetical protein
VIYLQKIISKNKNCLFTFLALEKTLPLTTLKIVFQKNKTKQTCQRCLSTDLCLSFINYPDEENEFFYIVFWLELSTMTETNKVVAYLSNEIY